MDGRAVVDYYDNVDEPGRLREGRGRLEFARVQELVRRLAPPPPGVVLDVGGAGGIHAAWLAGDGYAVDLVDPVPAHVDAATRLAGSLATGFGSELGDARALSAADGSCDLVLLFGPLYHLPERDDRLRAWSEAARVLRPGGTVMGMVISRWAADLDMCLRPPAPETPGFVPISYFHGMEEAAGEATEVGLTVTGTFGIEGPGWLVTDFDRRWVDDLERQRLVDLARATEQTSELLGIHAHLLVVARR